MIGTGATIGNSVFGLLQEQASPYPKEKRFICMLLILALTSCTICNSHYHPKEVAIYGDTDSVYRLSIFEATRNTLQGKSHAKCLVIDDSLLLPLMALNISNGSRVISLSPGLQENVATYLEAIADSNDFKRSFGIFQRREII